MGQTMALVRAHDSATNFREEPKNWLMIGSVKAGYRAADFMTLVSSALRK
jgi:hypothetical protein